MAATSDADPRPPARTRYIPRQWDVVVTSEGILKDGKLVKVEKEERFYKGISVRTLPPSLKKEYEELLLQEEQVHKQ